MKLFGLSTRGENSMKKPLWHWTVFTRTVPYEYLPVVDVQQSRLKTKGHFNDIEFVQYQHIVSFFKYVQCTTQNNIVLLVALVVGHCTYKYCTVPMLQVQCTTV